MYHIKLPAILPILALLTMGLSQPGCQNHASMTKPALSLTGHTVSPASAGDSLKAGHGHFSLENIAAETATVNLTSLTLLIGEAATALTPTTVYDQGKERSLDPTGFKVAAREKLDLLLGFPEVPYSDAAGLRVEIVATFSDGKMAYSAISPVIHTRRIPH